MESIAGPSGSQEEPRDPFKPRKSLGRTPLKGGLSLEILPQKKQAQKADDGFTIARLLVVHKR
jgi:hypothetical protein